jgi:nicotinate-nucleotide adenylyltransferase
MQELEQMYPQHTFSFCIGSDLLLEFNRWKNWKKIISQYPIVIYQRGFIDENITTICARLFAGLNVKDVRVISGENIIVTNISSSMVRAHYRSGKSVKYLVPRQVFEYITKHNLYK